MQCACLNNRPIHLAFEVLPVVVLIAQLYISSLQQRLVVDTKRLMPLEFVISHSKDHVFERLLLESSSKLEVAKSGPFSEYSGFLDKGLNRC